MDLAEPMRPSFPVLLNRDSGGSDEANVPDRIREAFRAEGAEADVRTAEGGEEFLALAKEVASRDFPVVVGAGGDGTISALASVLTGSGKTLGVLPLGTLNHFAKDLRIPLDLEGAVRNVVHGRESEVDVGEVNGRTFVNNSSLGLYPKIVRHREERQKLGWGKWPAFVWATIHTLHRHRPIDVTLSADGHEIRRATPFVFVGNNAYEMDGFDVGTRERLDRGELSVYTAPGARPIDLVVSAFLALIGRLRAARRFEVLRTSEFRIAPRGDLVRVAADGEIVMMRPPLRYRVRPRALKVMVPPEAEEGGAS